MKKSVLKICSLVFAGLCLIGLVLLLCYSVSLPYTETYRVWGTTYTQHYSGYFNADNLDAIILTAMGTFWGLVLFFVTPCGRCTKKSSCDETSEAKPESDCGCGCEDSGKEENN